MLHRIITTVLAAALVASLVALAAAWRAPGNNQGYAPVQPIAFSHRQHAGDLQISCRYCHASAEASRYAGIPAPSVCMNCHEQVTASFDLVERERERELARQEARPPGRTVSAELWKLYDAMALDEDLRPVAGRSAAPIRWVRVHTLPDFVAFDHSAHTAAGVRCAACHGPVATMERVRQVETLSMGWCVNCHREANRVGIEGRAVQASTDCTACHY